MPKPTDELNTPSNDEEPHEIENPSTPVDSVDENKVRKIEETHRSSIRPIGLKKFFIEGLMIFLAVSLGFIADNIREKIGAKNQAKIYAASMLNDLEADTTELRNTIDYLTYASNNIDTLFRLLSTDDPKDIPSGKLYWYGLWGGAQHQLIPNDATFQQMKNSGSLRYFTNSTLSEKVAQYDELWRHALTEEMTDRDLYVEVRKSRAKIFEFKYNRTANAIYQSNKNYFQPLKIDSFIETNPPLLTYDKTIFNEYLELVRSRNLRSKTREADALLQSATTLAEELKKQYPPEK